MIGSALIPRTDATVYKENELNYGLTRFSATRLSAKA